MITDCLSFSIYNSKTPNQYVSSLLFFLLGLENGGPFIDQVLVLQNYAEGWTDGKWEEKVDERPCIEKFQYSKDKQGYYR